jgi:hypothetical protein
VALQETEYSGISSTFGSEFVALWTAVDMIEGLQYKLRMMGIPLDGKTSVF